MSVALSFCPSLSAPPPASGAIASPSRITTLLAASAAFAIALAAGIVRPADGLPAAVTPFEAATLVAHGDVSSAALLDAAETVRARLLSISGVGSVSLRGLQPGGVEVDYAPARLARFGLTAADLRAALPVQAGRSAPGRLAIQQDAAQSGPQSLADMPVVAGGHVLRVGDVATVVRTALPIPVATLRQDGAPAVELVVTPASGSDGSLERRVAAGLARATLPADIRVR